MKKFTRITASILLTAMCTTAAFSSFTTAEELVVVVHQSPGKSQKRTLMVVGAPELPHHTGHGDMVLPLATQLRTLLKRGMSHEDILKIVGFEDFGSNILGQEQDGANIIGTEEFGAN